MFLELSPSQFTTRYFLGAPPGGDTEAEMFAVIEFVDIGYLSELCFYRFHHVFIEQVLISTTSGDQSLYFSFLQSCLIIRHLRDL